MWRILILADRNHLKSQITRTLKRPDRDLVFTNSLAQAQADLKNETFHMVIVDDAYFEFGKDALIEAVLREEQRVLPVILLCSFRKGHTHLDFEGLEHWVCIKKPMNRQALARATENLLDQVRYPNMVNYLRHKEKYIYRFSNIIAASPPMRSVMTLVQKVAGSNSSILLTGEKGTGKEMIAALMHFNSPRASNNFVSVHCGTMHGNPLEEELFGYEKGASTQANKRRIGRIEQANGGTLFLQEIGELPGTTQAKILRTIQLKQFERLGGTQKVQIEARLICSSSQDLKQNIAKGAFREDLFYRINAIQIHLPPLRERIEDIPALAQFFLHKFRGQHGKRDIGFAPNAIEMMMEYNWPGNVGELEVVVNRALMLCSGDSIVPEDLKFSSAGPPNGNESFALNGQSLDLEQLERTAITQALEQAKGVQKDAAKLLGISPRVIHYKIQKHNIDA